MGVEAKGGVNHVRLVGVDSEQKKRAARGGQHDDIGWRCLGLNYDDDAFI